MIIKLITREFIFGIVCSILGSILCIILGNNIDLYGDKTGPLVALFYAMPAGSLIGYTLACRQHDLSKYRNALKIIILLLISILGSFLASRLLLFENTSILLIPLLLGLTFIAIQMLIPMRVRHILQRWHTLSILLSVSLNIFGVMLITLSLDNFGGGMILAAPLIIEIFCLIGNHAGLLFEKMREGDSGDSIFT